MRRVLRLSDDPNGNVFIKGLKKICVKNADEAYRVMLAGELPVTDRLIDRQTDGRTDRPTDNLTLMIPYKMSAVFQLARPKESPQSGDEAEPQF